MIYIIALLALLWSDSASAETTFGPVEPCFTAVGDEKHSVLNITGPVADDILRELRKNGPVKELKEMGLTIYASRDGLIQCDITTPENWSCYLRYDRKTSRLIHTPVCD